MCGGLGLRESCIDLAIRTITDAAFAVRIIRQRDRAVLDSTAGDSGYRE